MNNFYKTLKSNQLTLLFCLLLAISGTVRSQHINYQNDSGWKIGFNMGGVWQQSDMKSKAGIGFGATLGKALYQKPGRYFAFDLRFRYLHGYNYGYTDTAITQFPATSIYGGNNTANPTLNAYQSQGKMFYNYRMALNEYSMEGVLTFNRLRERTGIVLYTWGGIGLTTYRVKTDQIDNPFLGSGTPYNYTAFDSTATWSQLSGIWDGEYETDADLNRGLQVGFMPSWGIGFGYQFAPYFAMVLEHKVTFALNDKIDGYAYKNPETPVNDRYHYTGLKFVFHFGKGNGQVYTNYNTTTTTTTATTSTSTVVTTPPRARPIINITQPSMSPATVSNQYYTVNANIYNIDGPSNINFKVNGNQSTNFTYNTSTQQFSSSILLNPGSNVVEIRATNEVGSDYQSVVIVFDMPIINNIPPPIVTFTNPPFTPFNTNNQSFNVTATILNVANSSGIAFKVNGQTVSGFSYNPTSRAFSAVIGLHAGPNTVEIKATNTAGMDVKQVVINYQPVVVQQPPVVTITNPTLNPYTVYVNSANVDATVLNVSNSSDIRLRINGQLSPNFTYNTTTKVMNVIASLIPGPNTFEITATNAAGTDSKSTTIVYVAPSALPPVITFIDPATNPATVTTSTKTVRATVQNVAGQSNIQVRLNGIIVPNFSWNASTKVVQFNATLNPGANTVQITATNTVGSDIKATTIIYQQVQTGQPPIVSISTPAQNPYATTSPNASIIGSVLNVNSQSQITFKVNGVPSNSFTYDVVTKVFLANVTLNPGTNVYEISATNNFGSDSRTQTINYTLPCNAPVITLVQPASANFQTSLSNLPFTAIVQNIGNQSSITFKLNGNAHPFTYNAASGTVTATLNLSGTSNTVELKATNNCGMATQSILIYYQAPLVPPVVTITTPATNPFTSANASTAIAATIQHVSSAANVSLKVNGTSVAGFTFNPQTTLFSANVNLISGANTIEITGTNNDGSDSKSTVIIYQPVAPPCQQPVIVLTQPAGNNYSTAQSSLQVTANILNVTTSTGIVFRQNGTNVPFTFNSATGAFSANVNFTQPTNNLEIIATNSCGSSTSTISVTYNRPLVPPVVTILNPGQNPFNSAVANMTLTANILNITGSSNITYTINGVSSTNFTFNPTTNVFTSNLTLVSGNNVFTISATNADGSDSKSTTIIYTPVVVPCNAPVITPIAPATASQTVNLANYSIQASVLNATQSQITLKQNGVSKTFTYNPTTFLLSASVTLVDGTNNFEILATNNCGSETTSFSIDYNRPLVPPVVTITQPAADPYTSATQNTTITASILHINGSSDISFKVNGVPSTSFTYNATTKIFSSAITLTPGNNSVEIIATNTDGSANDSRTIIYQYVAPCNPPVATITAPAANTIVAVPFATFTAAVTNSSQNAISLKLNGTTVPFTYTNGTVSANLTLVEGGNVVELTAGSNCGTASESVTITYNRPLTPPTVTISAPQNGSTTQTSTSTVNATITNIQNTSGIVFLVNGNPSTSFNFNAANNSFTASVSLNPGVNTFVITATNQDGQASDQTSITYQPCIAPQIVLSQPSATGTTVANAAFNLVAMVQNGANTTSSVTLNGANVSATSTGNAINAGLTLVAGTNTIVINVTGPCGNDSETITIIYTPCFDPEIQLNQSGVNGSTVSSPAFAFSGTVANASGTSLSVTLNGSNANTTYSNGSFNGNLTLAQGLNTIVITVTGPCGTDSKTIQITYTPCNAPLITINPNSGGNNVANAAYTITGTVANNTGTTVAITLNGTAVTSTYSEGSFSAGLNLNSGTNTIVVTVTGPCGNATQTVNVTYTPCNAPVITLNQTNANGTDQSNASFALSGSVSNHSGTTISVQLNGAAVNATYSNGNFNASLTLAAGSNTILVTVNGPCGSDTKTISLTHTPCVAPVITMTSPSSSGITVSNPSFTVIGSVAAGLNNVIKVKVNGTEVFTTSTANSVNTNVTLNQGSNNIEILVNGDCGSAQSAFAVTYTPCNAPVVNVAQSSANNSTQTAATFSLSGSVNNYQGTTLTVQLNGGTVNSTFANGNYSAGLTLVPGSNNIVITAAGTCGTDTKTLAINHTPCVTPLIGITNPSAANTSSTTASFTVSGAVTGGLNNAVTVKHNGTEIYQSTTSNNINVPLTLNQGSNTILVSVAGDCGNASQTYTVNYTPCNAPVVSITQPSATVTSASATISGTVQHHAGTTITVNVNGTPVNATYSNGNFTANATLANGSNTILVTASGSCGTASSTATVTYTAPAPAPCGPRFNPGNSAWEFCLITPSGTYTRDNLAANPNFTYTGPASSAYFKPIAGGGDAIVNGAAYPVQNGSYYHFSGNLTVTVGSNQPGSMGHWTICIESNAVPVFGNGNNRPASPCESTNQGGGNNNQGGGNNNQGGGNNSGNGDSTVDFDINPNGSVTVSQTVCANIKCLGESVVYSNSQDAFVKISYSVDNGVTWSNFNNNNYVNGGEQESVLVPTGSNVVLKAFCTTANGSWTNTIKTNTGSQYVYVLRNGDPAPNIQPFQNQASAEAFLAGVMTNGVITIGPNDVIYLFELRFVGNVGVDYQDAVMLVTFDENGNCSNDNRGNTGGGSTGGNNSGRGNNKSPENTGGNTGTQNKGDGNINPNNNVNPNNTGGKTNPVEGGSTNGVSPNNNTGGKTDPVNSGKDVQNNTPVNNREYTEAISAGDRSFGELRYADAKTHYTRALTLKPGDPYATQKIKDCDQMLDRKRIEEDAQRKAQEDAQKKAQQDAQRKAQEDAQRKAQQDAQRKAQEDAQRKAQEDAQRKAQEDAQRKEDAAKKAAAEKAAADAKKKQEEEKKKQESEKRSADPKTLPGGKVGVTVNEEGVKQNPK